MTSEQFRNPSDFISNIHDHLPATHSEIKKIMATLQEDKDALDALSAVVHNLVSKVNELKALLAAQNVPAATEADLTGLKEIIDGLSQAGNSVLA